ncbi:serine hydrolase [Mycolicibacterium cosmeticum]|uniref:Beta-lactamase n=1 Tax=Mycolicibacterium cosmeticum TaxID=258533 RepID=W9AY70_MYCCO|nr:serine hydrolase [Mycolicibacterium cosmeticum]CDO10483.1 beta-lactamase [Mycolicibacterium cosmeticum]
MQASELGEATGDSDLIARVEPLARAARLTDRLSVVSIRGGVHRHAHFGAGPGTVYEIGSVTKTLTSLLFAEAVESGELRTDTRVGSLLDLDSSPAADVTLEELASHRSGLPRVATGLRDRANAIVAVLRHRNPYTADLQGLLTQARGAKIAGRGQFSYSNLGAALLGQALAAHAGTGFPELLHRHLFTRLGMTRSNTPLSSLDLPAGAPTGWSARGTREQAWTLGAYAPAGGVRSTAADMATYAQALLDGEAPGLTALEPRWDAGNGSRVGYGWFTDRVADVDIAWHNGATGGFSSMLALDRAGAAAVVMLANTAVAVDEIALRLLVDAT